MRFSSYPINQASHQLGLCLYLAKVLIDVTNVDPSRLRVRSSRKILIAGVMCVSGS
jgi:hypothetical protein